MAENSGIEWTDHTMNPWIGCTRISPACDSCYAERWARRSGLVTWGAGQSRRRTSNTNWKKPLAWNRKAVATGIRQRVFAASLSDIFDKEAPQAWRDDFFNLVRDTPGLDWLILSKRPQNAPAMLPADWGQGYANVWIGTTTENHPEARRRLPRLFTVPAVRYFASMEPLLGPVDVTTLQLSRPPVGLGLPPGPGTYDALAGTWQPHAKPTEAFTGLPRLDWVITGGESGPHARPTHPDWVRTLRDTCLTTGTAFFHKQWGAWRPTTDAPHRPGFPDVPSDWHDRPDYTCIDLAGTTSSEDGKVFFQRLPKKKAGRDLDGRTWNQVPGYHN